MTLYYVANLRDASRKARYRSTRQHITTDYERSLCGVRVQRMPLIITDRDPETGEWFSVIDEQELPLKDHWLNDEGMCQHCYGMYHRAVGSIGYV